MKSHCGAEDYAANAPWAMVPLKPNELRRPEDIGIISLSVVSARPNKSTTMKKEDFEDRIDSKCAFNLRV